MNERWDLEDLYRFPHSYAQSHSFIYCLDSELDQRDVLRINTALEGYPWQGGYSYVNIYSVLEHQVPPSHRPKVAAIHYASPGWMDIAMNPEVAIRVAKSVGILLGLGVAAVKAIQQIDKARLEMARERKKNSVKLAQLSADEAKALSKMSDELAKYLGFRNVRALDQRTRNPEVTLKLLSAHHRRLKILADYVNNGKVKLPEKLRDEE